MWFIVIIPATADDIQFRIEPVPSAKLNVAITEGDVRAVTVISELEPSGTLDV